MTTQKSKFFGIFDDKSKECGLQSIFSNPVVDRSKKIYNWVARPFYSYASVTSWIETQDQNLV